MNFIARLLITAAVAYGLTYVVKGVKMDNYGSAVIFAGVLALVNVFVRPLLVILTIPVTILTFGLFLIVINALMILLVDWMMESVHFAGFWTALLFSLLLSFVTPLIYALLGDKGEH
jgi:putative membrane protein